MIQMNPSGALSGSRRTNDMTGRTSVAGFRRMASDAVNLSGGKIRTSSKGLGLSWATSLRAQKHQEHENQSMHRLAKMLPVDELRRPSPERFETPQTKLRLTESTERLLLEGLDGDAKVVFQNAIDMLYQQYSEDLQLDSADQFGAREALLREAKSMLEDYAIKPWSPFDRSSADSLEGIGQRLEEKVLRHRQMVLESSGDFSRVLSELTISAKNGDDVDAIRLGDFIVRMSEALDARSTAQIRDRARAELTSGQTQLIDDDALSVGRSFIEYLHSLRA